MIMLERNGMYSGIVDGFDEKILQVARGERPDIVEIVHKVMDGEAIEMGSLSKEMVDYVKTAKVILGQTLFSDSGWEI